MTHIKDKSLELYAYLCYKICDEETVKTRRLNTVLSDAYQNERNMSCFLSGSKAEGLDLPGSDTDVMTLFKDVIVCESDEQAYKVTSRKTTAIFVMDTVKTNPCFTRLRVFRLSPPNELFLKCIQQHDQVNLLSSNLFKSQALLGTAGDEFHIHGPCVARGTELDMAFCIRCDKWVSSAEQWITRPTTWPSVELIHSIVSLGVLFVPIGCNGSKYEEIEWRFSFSLAERLLVYSFNHTQLLCYALLKIVLKEIICQEQCLKDTFCSYFIKTIMFWMSEESVPTQWRPDNIIPCFEACLERLSYCIKETSVQHYFIPEYNMLENRISNEQTNELVDIIQMLKYYSWQCIQFSETLRDVQLYPLIKRPLSECTVNTKPLSKSIANLNPMWSDSAKHGLLRSFEDIKIPTICIPGGTLGKFISHRIKTGIHQVLQDLKNQGYSCFMENLSDSINIRIGSRRKCDLSNYIISEMDRILSTLRNEGLHCYLSCGESYESMLLHAQSNITRLKPSHVELFKFMQLSHRPYSSPHQMLNMLIHQAKTSFTIEACLFHFSKSVSNYSHHRSALSLQFLSNKEHYWSFKQRLSRMVCGLHIDAVSGWLMIAALFYEEKRYIPALHVVEYAMSKCSAEMFYAQTLQLFGRLQNHHINNVFNGIRMSKYLKLFVLDDIVFYRGSPLIPAELRLHTRLLDSFSIPPVVFGHFLSCLCYHHLNAVLNCMTSMKFLELKVKEDVCSGFPISYKYTGRRISFLCLGVAFAMANQADKAKECFQKAKKCDVEKSTSSITLPRNHYSRVSLVFS